MARVHRFRDCVELNVDGANGATVYMTAHDAAKLAADIKRVVKSIKSGESYAASNCDGRALPDWPDYSNAQAAAKESSR